MPRILSEHVALDAARSDTVDGHAVAAKVGRKSLDQSNDRHLGGVVKSMVLDTEQSCGNRCHEDETSIGLAVLVGGLADEELCAGVEVEDMVEFLLGDILGLVPGFCAGIAHDDVDFAKVLL